MNNPHPQSPSPKTLPQCRAYVLSQLNSKSSLPLVCLTTQKEKLLSILQPLVSHGESTSALLVGQRGTGKKSVLKSTMKEIEERFYPRRFFVVRINGFFHARGVDGLCEILKQLQSFSLHLPQKIPVLFQELSACLKDALQFAKKENNPIVFVLEEFDLFALEKQQYLLYFLLDLIQQPEYLVAVVGTTCRFDAVELLEKRVRSRFSETQIFFTYIDTLEDMLIILKNMMLIPTNSESTSDAVVFWNNNVNTLVENENFIHLIFTYFNISRDLREYKNLIAVALSKVGWSTRKKRSRTNEDNTNDRSKSTQKSQSLTNKDTISIVDRIMNFTMEEENQSTQTSSSDLNNFSLASVPSLEDFEIARNIVLEEDHTFQLLNSLSVLELGLLVSCKRLLEKQRQTNLFVNFKLIYDEFINSMDLAGTKHLKLDKSVCIKAFEHLVFLEIFLPVGSIKSIGTVSRPTSEYQAINISLDFNDIDLAVKKKTELPTSFITWATKWLN